MAPRSAGPDHAPVVAIVGETASGKTALAIELAKHFNGEIICADSRTVYKGMDVGTAKPTPAERQGVPHYGLDVVTPGEQFTAHDFQQLALAAISDIASRGKLPIMVGGTGLYVDGLLYSFAFRPPSDEALRDSLEGLSIEELQGRIVSRGYPLPENAQNKRHLTRLLESGPAPKQPHVLRPATLVIGLRSPSDQLEERLAARVEQMFAAGLIEEVRSLITKYGNTEALKAPGYKAVGAYLRGETSLEEAKTAFVRADWNLAKRQRTWFKRNSDIQWLDGSNRFEQAVALITTLIS